MRYLDVTLPTIEENLALDEALLIEAEERSAGPTLRFWEPHETAVVLGASCRIEDDVRLDACRADGVSVARRSSGGGTVVVGPGTLNVTVVLPVDAAPGLGMVDLAHAYVLERIAAAIRARGPAVEVLGQGDLTLDLRKFSGSAQRRLREHFFVHASILYRFPIEAVGRYTALPHRQPPYRSGRSHEDFLVNLPLPRASLVDAIRSAWPESRESPQFLAIPEDLVDELRTTKFADPGWLARL